MFVKTNTDRHLIAKASNAENRKAGKRGDKTTNPACRPGSSPMGRPASEAGEGEYPGTTIGPSPSRRAEETEVEAAILHVLKARPD